MLSILESSYIIHFLEADTNNLGRTVIKTPKMYFVDTGLLCHLLSLESTEELLLSRYKGAVVETFAIAELLKQRTNLAKKSNLSFFRDKNGLEIDTIADWKHNFIIEIKSSISPEANFSKNTKKYVELSNNNEIKQTVFYLGENTMTINNTLYVAWKDWGELARKNQ